MSKKPWYSVTAAVGPTATIGIYEDIGAGGLTALDFNATLSRLKSLSVKNINLEISSNGGDVAVGFAIIDMLNRYPGRIAVRVTGLAASMASAIAMTGREITMPQGSMMMIYDPWGATSGGPEQIESFATALKAMRVNLIGVYAKRTNIDPAKIADMMRVETWMTAKEAVRLGFADRVEGELKAAALAALPSISKFTNAPTMPRGLDALREAAFEKFNYKRGGRHVARKS